MTSPPAPPPTSPAPAACGARDWADPSAQDLEIERLLETVLEAWAEATLLAEPPGCSPAEAGASRAKVGAARIALLEFIARSRTATVAAHAEALSAARAEVSSLCVTVARDAEEHDRLIEQCERWKTEHDREQAQKFAVAKELEALRGRVEGLESVLRDLLDSIEPLTGGKWTVEERARSLLPPAAEPRNTKEEERHG